MVVEVEVASKDPYAVELPDPEKVWGAFVSVDRAAIDAVAEIDADSQGEADTVAEKVAREESVPRFELCGDELPAGNERVYKVDGLGEAVKETVASTEMVLVAEVVTLLRGDFEAEGEEDSVALTLPEVVGKRGDEDGMNVELKLVLMVKGTVPDTDAVSCTEVVPLFERSEDTEEREESEEVGVESKLGLEGTDAVVHELRVAHSRVAVAFAQGVGK